MFTRILLIGALLAASLGYFLAGGWSTDAPKPPPIQGRNKTVLFFANEEHGLSNVHVATAAALLENYPDIEVHYATFGRKREKLARVSAMAREKTPAARDIIFHEVSGTNLEAAMSKLGYTMDTSMQPPGLKGLDRLIHNLHIIAAPWPVEEHLSMYRQMSGLIDEIDPAVVVLDFLFRPALDATWEKNRLHAIVTPNPLGDLFQESQPYGGVFWKYPALSTGFPFPVPPSKILENIYVNIRLVWTFLTMTGLAEQKKILKAHGISNPLLLSGFHRDDAPLISAHTEGAAIPVDYVPPNVTAAGPIVLGSLPAAQQDPELTKWLKKAPTVLINLGSIFRYDEQRAVAMSHAIIEVLTKTDAQVLWKFKKWGEYPDSVLSHLQPYIDGGRLRMSSWLTADPFSLLETGDIVTFVHHGGAGCYHEAVAAGVPQLILPLWIDLYGFAALSEGMGLGIWGCKESSPDWTAECLGSALLEAVGDSPVSKAIREKSKQLGQAIQAKEKGRDIAAREIAKLAYVK